jgi:broad specificity phosphatase PhoE
MHTLYFTRHGETVWNVENKICGMTDSPLTERGRQQARKLGEAVKASGVHIDEILYSPLHRWLVKQRLSHDRWCAMHPPVNRCVSSTA